MDYNRLRYLQLKYDLSQIREELASLKDELTAIMVSTAPSQRIAAIQPATLPPLASQATAPPLASQATSPPLASQATAPPLASQAMAPPLVSQAISGHVGATTYSPPVLNADGTISRRMDQVSNNAIVTFSGNEEMASKKSKLFGSSAKLDTFTGYDMNQFPEWVVQFLSGVNLFQPTEPNACRGALHLLRGKAAEMVKNIPQQVSMTKLQELLTGLDKLFNTTGNRIVAVSIFNSFSQREDVSVQDYSIGIEHLFYLAYP